MTWHLLAVPAAAALALGLVAGRATVAPQPPQHCAVAAGPVVVEPFGPGALAECDKLLALQADGRAVYRPVPPGTGTYVCLAAGRSGSAIVRSTGIVLSERDSCANVADSLGASAEDFQ